MKATLTIAYTNRRDQLKRAEWKGQPTDKYMLNGNLVQWFEINGRRASFDEAMAFMRAAKKAV